MPDDFHATGRTWVKLYCQFWIGGSTRREMPDPAHRAIFIDLIALAGLSPHPGRISPGKNPETGGWWGYPVDWYCSTLAVTRDDFLGAVALCERWKKVSVERSTIGDHEELAIHVTNWEKYQSEYQRQRPYRADGHSDGHEEREPAAPDTPAGSGQDAASPVKEPVAPQKPLIPAAPAPAVTPTPAAGAVPAPEDLTSFKSWQKRLEESNNKVGIIGDLAVFLTGKNQDYARIGQVCRANSSDYGYIMAVMWKAAASNPAGDFLNYVGGVIRATKARAASSNGVPQRPEVQYNDLNTPGGKKR